MLMEDQVNNSCKKCLMSTQQKDLAHLSNIYKQKGKHPLKGG